MDSKTFKEYPEQRKYPKNLSGRRRTQLGEKLIVVTKKKETLAPVLSGQKDLFTLIKTEWIELLNPSPLNKLVYNY